MKLERVEISKINLSPAPAKKMAMKQVSPVKLAENGSGQYDIVDGHGRINELLAQGETDVWAIVEKLTVEEVHWQSLATNLSVRENAMKSALDIKFLLKQGYTQTEIGKRLNVSQSLISQLNSLNELPGELQAKILAGLMPANAGYKALDLPPWSQQALFDVERVTIKMVVDLVGDFRDSTFDLSDLAPVVNDFVADQEPVLPPREVEGEGRRKLVLNGNSWDRLNDGEVIIVEWAGLKVEVRARAYESKNLA